MDPNKKPEEAAATSEMDKGKMAAASEEEPAPTSDMDISEEEEEESEEEPAPTSEMDKGKRPASSSSEEESSEEEPAPRHSDLVTDAAETAARLIAEAEFKEKVAELAAIRMQIARNIAEESQIRLKVFTELRDKTLRGEKVILNWPPPKHDQDGDDKDKDK